MEIQLTPEQEYVLTQLAQNKGQAADTLAADVLGHYLNEEALFIAAVKLGESELERGEFLTNQQVSAHLEKLFNS